MKEESLKAMKSTINKWLEQKNYTFQVKESLAAKSTIVDNEFRLKFTSALHGFICKGKEIPIFLVSKELHTTTLSDSPLSQNANSDNYRLAILLKEFDEEFDELVNKTLTDCDDTVFTTDPLFFK